ncbi:MAG: hypothetical protein AMXMBFR53_36390 [Gemmatimonadota bacterium]
MSLKHGVLGTNVVRDRHYVRNPATGLNERALLVEPALTNRVEFNIPGGTATDVEMRQLDAVTNLSGEYAAVIPVAPGYYCPMPANFNPDRWCVPIFAPVNWSNGDGAAHVFGVIYADANNSIEWGKNAAGDLYCTVIANGTTKTATLTLSVAAGAVVFFGARLYSGTLTVYADTDGDNDVSDNTATATSVPASTGASWTFYPGRNYAGTSSLEGGLNLLLTNDGSDASAITDRFNAGAGMALGGDMGWLARVSGNGSRHGENLVLHVGGNVDGTAIQLDTAHNALSLLAGTATGRVDLSSGNYLTTADPGAGADGLAAASWAFKYSPDQVALGVGVVGRWDGGSDNQWIAYFPAGGAAVSIYIASAGGDNTNYVTFTVSGGLVVGTEYWFHVTYNAGTVALYYKVLDSTTREFGAQQTPSPSVTGTIPVTLRSCALGYSFGVPSVDVLPTDGKLDDVRIWYGKTLTSAQADADLINEPGHGGCPMPDHWWPFDGDGTDVIGGLTATWTGTPAYVDDGRHHYGRMERWLKQGQYYTDGVNDKITHGNYSALDGATYAVLDLILTPLNNGVLVWERGRLGTDGQLLLENASGGTLNIYVPTSAADTGTYGSWTSLLTVGQPIHLRAEFDGSQPTNATRLVLKTETLDTATGLWGGLSAVSASSFSGTIPATLQTVATNTTVTVGCSTLGAAFAKMLVDRFALHAGSIPASKTPYESGAASYDIWCDYNGNANNAGLGGATYNGTVSGAIQWYDGRQPEGWTLAAGVEVDRATGTNQSSEGTFGLRLKGTSTANALYVSSLPATTVGRWGVWVGSARETTDQVRGEMVGTAYSLGFNLPTQATLASVGAAMRAVGTGPGLRFDINGINSEAYIDNLRAIQLATVSLSVSTATSQLPGIEGKGGAWGVADASSVTASSEGIPLPYDASLGSTIVKLTSGPAGSGVRRYLFGLPGEMNGFTAGQVAVLVVGVYIPAASEIGYADVKLRAVDDVGSTDGTAAPGDGAWHWLWCARKWDASATEAYFELRFADGVALAGASQALYMALPSIHQGAGIGAPITNSAEGSASATAADSGVYATSASAALASHTYYLRLFEVGTALAGGTIYHRGSGTAGADPRIVVEGVSGYYRAKLDDGSEEITSTATVAPTAGQVVELRIVIDATAKTIRTHQAVNHGSEVSAAASSALSGTFPAALAGNRRYFGSEAGSTPGTVVLLNEATFSGDVSLAACRQFAGI